MYVFFVLKFTTIFIFQDGVDEETTVDLNTSLDQGGEASLDQEEECEETLLTIDDQDHIQHVTTKGNYS